MDSHAIVMADAEGIIRVWSPGAERLFGFGASSAIGQTLDLLVPDDYQERHWDGFRAAVSKGKTKLDQPAANLPVACSDGSVRRIPGRLILLRDAHDSVVGVIAIFGPGEESDPTLPNV